MRLYVELNARPEMAREAATGFPSPWKTLAKTPQQAMERVSRDRVSVLDSCESVIREETEG